MSDFEDRLTEALGGNAGDAPTGHLLAEGARRRLRVRRRRLAAVGGVAAVLAVAVPVAVLGGSWGGGTPGKGDEVAPADRADTVVTCVSWASWPASAMVDGIPNDVDDAEVRNAFARLRKDFGIDAPRAIQEHGAEAAPYVVLAVNDQETALGVGGWTLDGPRDDGQVVELTPTQNGYKAVGWGDCRDLSVALPEGRSQVEVTAPKGGVDRGTTAPVVMVHERDCTSSRDPRPYLGEPQIVETDDRVTVTLSSEEFEGGATCPGNPNVPLTLELDEPIGDRELFDAGTWPPTPIPVSEWQTVESEDVRAEIPPDWRRFTCDFDGFERDVFGPSEGDACDFGTYAAFYDSATFDPMHLPGIIAGDEGDGWGGYVYAGDQAVSVSTEDLGLTRQILASARTEGQPEVEADAWAELSGNGVTYDAPVRWGVDARAGDGYFVRVDEVEPIDSSLETAEQLDATHYRLQRQLPGRLVTIVAPTSAVADLVWASVARAVGQDGQSFEFDGVTFELPADWEQLDCPADTESYGSGSLICGRGEYLTFYARALFDPAMEPGQVISGKEGAETLWTGYVYAGDWAVFVRTYDRQLTEDILATVHE